VWAVRILQLETDISSLSDEYVANMLLKVSDSPTSNFMQSLRRRLSILERPLVTARGGGEIISMQTSIQSMLKWLSLSCGLTTTFAWEFIQREREI
jgi:hypothetical protein